MRDRYILPTILLAAIATCSAVVGQSGDAKKSEMIDSFGRVPNGDLRGRLDLFLATLANRPDAKGLVHVLGTPAQIAARTRLVQNHMRFRTFDASRVSFRSGRNVGDVRSDLWIIPPGADQPEFKHEAWIASEVLRAYKREADKAFDSYFLEVKRLADDHQSFIINYGTPQQIAMREKWLREALKRNFGYHYPRMTFVNGGPGPVRTVMWLVPPGAENPTP